MPHAQEPYLYACKIIIMFLWQPLLTDSEASAKSCSHTSRHIPHIQSSMAGKPLQPPQHAMDHTIRSSSTKPLPMPSRASAASLMFLPARILPFLALGLLRCSWRTAAGLVGLGRAACSAISSSVAPPVTFFVLLRLGRLLFGFCLLASGGRLLQKQKSWCDRAATGAIMIAC